MRTAIAFAAVIACATDGASAQGYHPASLSACQARATSTLDNSNCFAAESDRLAARLPPGSASWRSSMEAMCRKKFEMNGSAAGGMTSDCILQALAARVSGTGASSSVPPPQRSGATPVFSDSITLVVWLVQHAGAGGFKPTDEAANANVFTPGLRAALRASLARSRQRNEPPCGADGDIILDTQEFGPVMGLRVNSQPTAPDRATTSALFDIAGYHRNQRFMTVSVDGAWKVDDIVGSTGTSLQRSLACGR